jgi:uncharacterized protein YsxB (DUF464 family)
MKELRGNGMNENRAHGHASVHHEGHEIIGVLLHHLHGENPSDLWSIMEHRLDGPSDVWLGPCIVCAGDVAFVHQRAVAGGSAPALRLAAEGISS